MPRQKMGPAHPQADLDEVERERREFLLLKARRQQTSAERLKEYHRQLALHKHEDYDEHFGASHSAKKGTNAAAVTRRSFS
jgi:hypothetical protein